MQKDKLLKFYSDSCMPCKFLTNVLKEEQIEHEAINIADDNNMDIVRKYGIRSVPVLIKVDGNDNEVSRLTGFPGIKTVIDFCNE